MLRRAIVEKGLLCSKKQPKNLEAPSIKLQPPKSGTGFANSASMDRATRLATEQAKVLKRDGVIRIDNALSPEISDALRQYLLDQQQVAHAATLVDPSQSRLFYGVEQSRKNRCDMHLSLLRGGIDAQGDEGEHVLANALLEILGEDGTLRAVYENLVTSEGEFYELAGIITNPGSSRQMIHPDLPYQEEAPLYVVFLALQDVTEAMGPTSFLLKTNTAKATEIFESGDMDAKDKQLVNADCRMATLKKGDAVLFDARVLHCGGANDQDDGDTRVMLNFSFRNPKVKGDLGYKGSMMPAYVGAMTLGDVCDALGRYSNGALDPFSRYGNGLKRR
jgi:Phytanoyl-CoA dioxygenase (PhyH)